MHAKIYQVTREELSRDEYITFDSYEPLQVSNYCDYTGEVYEYEEEDCLKSLDRILEGVFYREGRTLTYVGAENFMYEFVEAIKKSASELTVEKMKDWRTMFALKRLLDETHIEYEHRFVFGPDQEAFPESLGEFMQEVYVTLKPGDKLYVGGIVDFHY